MEFHELIKTIEVPSPYSDIDDSITRLTGCQQNLLSFINDSRFCVIYKRRQEGVSVAMAIYFLWLLINKPGYTIAIIGHNRTEKEIFRQMINLNLGKLEELFSKLGFEDVILTPEKHNSNITQLPNGSRIFYWTKNQPDAGRGHRIDFLYLSELTFRDDYHRLVYSLMPCLNNSNNSRFVITTTELNNIKEDLFMNGDGVDEYWTDVVFDGTRRVLIEKKNSDFIKYKF